MSSAELDFKMLSAFLAKVKSAGFDQAEVIVSENAETEMQIDAGDISLLRNTENMELTLRGIAGGRYAVIAINQLDNKSVDDGIAKLKEAAKSAPVDEARAFAPKHNASVVSDGPIDASLEAMYARVNAFVEVVTKKYPELVLEQSTLKFSRGRMLRANSLGLELDESEGYYSMMAMFSSKRGEKMSSFNYSGALSQDLSKALLEWGSMERLISNSVKEIDHVAFDGKFVGAAIMTPDVVYDMMGTWFSHIEDNRLIAGTSQLRDKIGQQVASPLLTVRVEPQSKEFARHEHTTGDGYPAKPSTVIEKGVLKTYALSDYGARKTGLPRSENGFSNRVIDAGTSSLEDMIKKTKKGLLLARFSGGSPAANGDFSGVVKNSFLIEDGRVTTPVSEMMISGNAFELMKSVTAVSRERVNDGGTLTPWIAVDGITFAGG
ncbi:TldD/PmbA family protein [soil metagenome]